MTKKKRNHPDVEEVLARPWCYYCERDFDDLKILINHQKAKHFKCERCGRRLNTAGGLSVHMSQVHKENLSAVDNALPNRAGLDIEIFGMEGIPDDISNQHTQRVLQSYHQAEADRRAAGGNTAAGGGPGGQSKKPKFESPSDLKKRLAEHKARLADQQANGGDSGSGTPVSANGHQSQPLIQNQHPSQQIASPQFGQYQQPFNNMQGAMPYAHPSPYSQAPPVNAFQLPPLQAFQPQPSFSPPPYQAAPPQYNPNQPFAPPIIQNGPPAFYNMQNGGPRTFGIASPVQQYHPHFQQPQSLHTPHQIGSLPQRSNSGSLPAAPGLPQRPAFGAPQVNAFQFQQMHQGQIPGSQAPPGLPQMPQQNMPSKAMSQPTYAPPPGMPLPQDSTNASSVDDLISDASKRADAVTPTPPPAFDNNKGAPETAEVKAPKEEPAEDKGAKKDKDKSKATKLVYSDNEISPEEKMAGMPRYAYTPDRKTMMV